MASKLLSKILKYSTHGICYTTLYAAVTICGYGEHSSMWILRDVDYDYPYWTMISTIFVN